MKKRTWFTLIVAALIIAVVNWWIFHKPQPPAPPTATTIKFGISAFQDTLLPYVSEQKGWYRDEGLNVQLVPLDWDAINEALATGRVDLAINNISGVISVHANAPNIIYLYGLNPFDNGSALMVRADGKLKTLKEIEVQVPDHTLAVRTTAAQLKGMTIITTGSTDMEQSVAAAVQRGGLQYPRDVKVLKMEPDEGLAAFLRGEGDAYLGGIPQRTALGKRGMLEMLTGSDLGPPPINGIVTTREYYRNHQQELLKILHVWFETVRYINDNEDDGANIIVKKMQDNAPGGQFTVEDFKKFWNNYEHYASTPQEAQSLILDPNGKNYWKAAWDDCNHFFYSIIKTIPAPVDANGSFLMPDVQKAYIAKYGNQ